VLISKAFEITILQDVYSFNHQSIDAMKKILGILALLLVSFTFVAAQGNGGNNGNGYGNNGQGPSFNAQQWLIDYLEAGNPVPHWLALDVIRDAREWGSQVCGLNLGQMIAKYLQGQLTVEYISTAPPSFTFRISYGGHDVVVIDSF
jgi:hypothetical protein